MDLDSQDKHLAVLQAKVRGGNQIWFLDSGCSRHLTGDKSNFLSLAAFDGGRVAVENGKSRKIVGVGKIGKSLSHSIDNVYLVDSLQHNLLSVSQLCGRANHLVSLRINT